MEYYKIMWRKFWWLGWFDRGTLLAYRIWN